MRFFLIATIVAVLTGAALVTVRPAEAMKPFFEEFKAMYVKPKATDRTALIFNEAVQAKGCTICHGKESKKTFNAYGAEVKKLLNKGDAVNHNTAKIRAALAKVSRLHSDPSDPKSPTFGERLKQGKLPVGEIHVRKKDAGQDSEQKQ